MEGVDNQAEHTGSIKDVRSNDFFLDRSMARDVYVPFPLAR